MMAYTQDTQSNTRTSINTVVVVVVVVEHILKEYDCAPWSYKGETDSSAFLFYILGLVLQVSR